eukprot:gene25594-biopygen10709
MERWGGSVVLVLFLILVGWGTGSETRKLRVMPLGMDKFAWTCPVGNHNQILTWGKKQFPKNNRLAPLGGQGSAGGAPCVWGH